MPADRITATFTDSEILANDFSHANWDKATPIQITKRWSGEEADPSQHAEARLVWSDEALCVRFVCHQESPPIVSESPKLDEKTIGVWDRDVCEIFLAPNIEEPNQYFEFEAAPNGEWVDLGINVTPGGKQTDWNYHSRMTTASHLQNDELTEIIRIPWSDSIPKPSSGDQWRVNLFRCVGSGNERYLAWQPTYTVEPNFHVPEVFGWLEFSGGNSEGN